MLVLVLVVLPYPRVFPVAREDLRDDDKDGDGGGQQEVHIEHPPQEHKVGGDNAENN